VQVAFIKTSTAYGSVRQPDGAYSYKGAMIPHLKLMLAHRDSNVQVKAVGGVRTLYDLLKVMAPGLLE